MQYRRLGKTDLEVSRVALGLWQAGGFEAWGGDYGEDDVIKTIQAAPDAGITLMDTAPMYGNGASEELLGRAIAGRRDEFVIATKVSTNLIEREQVREEVHTSLKRLNIDTIDLIQVHWPNTKGKPFAPTMQALAELRDEGKVRVIGVSNFDDQQLAECLETTRVDTLQPPYNLLWRHIEASTQPFCAEHEISMIPYSPLAQGLLTGKYDHDNRPTDKTRPRNLLWHGEAFNIAMKVVDALRDIAAKHDATCAQIALAWLLHRPAVASVIAGAKRVDQLRDNAKAADIALSDEEVKRLAEAGDPLTAMTAEEPKMWFTQQAGEYDVR